MENMLKMRISHQNKRNFHIGCSFNGSNYKSFHHYIVEM